MYTHLHIHDSSFKQYLSDVWIGSKFTVLKKRERSTGRLRQSGRRHFVMLTTKNTHRSPSQKVVYASCCQMTVTCPTEWWVCFLYRKSAAQSYLQAFLLGMKAQYYKIFKGSMKKRGMFDKILFFLLMNWNQVAFVFLSIISGKWLLQSRLHAQLTLEQESSRVFVGIDDMFSQIFLWQKEIVIFSN